MKWNRWDETGKLEAMQKSGITVDSRGSCEAAAEREAL